MLKYLMTALVVGMVVMTAAATAFAQESPPLFATVRGDPPITEPDRYLETHTVTLALESLHAPVERIVLNLPDHEPEIVTRLHWEPRQGYIQIPDPNDPTGFNSITIPDPSARPEDFHWRWYGRSANFTVGLTVEAGVVAGRVTGRVQRYAIEPRGNGRITLGGSIHPSRSAAWMCWRGGGASGSSRVADWTSTIPRSRSMQSCSGSCAKELILHYPDPRRANSAGAFTRVHEFTKPDGRGMRPAALFGFRVQTVELSGVRAASLLAI